MHGGELIQKDLQALAVGGGHFQREVFARVGLDGPAEPEVLEALLEGADGLDARQGEPAALHGVEAKAALILRPQANARSGIGRLHSAQLLLQAAIAESGECFFFFSPWLLQATLRVAPS